MEVKVPDIEEPKAAAGPKPTKKEKAQELYKKWSAADFNKIALILKIITLVEAALILINWIVRWAYIGELRSFSAFMIMWYAPFIITVQVMVEFGFFRSYFFLVNFGWGKGLFAFIMATLFMGPGRTNPEWNDTLTAIVLIILAFMLPLVSLMYRKDDVEWKWVMLQIEEGVKKAEAKKKLEEDKNALKLSKRRPRSPMQH